MKEVPHRLAKFLGSVATRATTLTEETAAAALGRPCGVLSASRGDLLLRAVEAHGEKSVCAVSTAGGGAGGGGGEAIKPPDPVP
eukprot:CAMPEP_0206512138 /NCGR_PEP_ID=MMETSP0324_2-20121206/60691_1 /ASSEMBLY_ACC=CAM_ASM_000836 /TAXON_ID=2866 /ORGANISM="Crypthecodinium cohnii, Strain Seligo" /LENGTH=83 /DNA_ID=CAMNT_0054004019 /DNA_START=377 /DNA_END=629 /DNA_ORIENTATION=-